MSYDFLMQERSSDPGYLGTVIYGSGDAIASSGELNSGTTLSHSVPGPQGEIIYGQSFAAGEYAVAAGDYMVEINTTGPVSYHLWLKLSGNLPNDDDILYFRYEGDDGSGDYLRRMGSGLFINLQDKGQGSAPFLVPPSVDVTQWFAAGISFSGIGPDVTQKGYINGELVDTQTVTTAIGFRSDRYGSLSEFGNGSGLTTSVAISYVKTNAGLWNDADFADLYAEGVAASSGGSTFLRGAVRGSVRPWVIGPLT